MKFDEMISKSKSTKKSFNTKMLFLAVVGILGIILVIYVFTSISSSKKTIEITSLDKNSRLVQSLYTTVHDFKSTSPYWMYDGESSSLISNMSESNKMVLAYLNLKGVDFLEAEDCSSLPSENAYGKLVCSDRTIIKREDVERSYQEVFGDGFLMTTDVNIKVNPNNDTYVYIEDVDSYVLYTQGSKDELFSKDFTYNYDIYKAEKEGDVVRVYESLDVEDKTGVIVESAKYLYTFKMSDDNLYSFYSIESVK